MAMSLNKVLLLGRLGDDPDLSYTGSGTAVCNMSIATNRVWKDQHGNTQERTDWHKIVVWGKTAEACKKYLIKGQRVHVEGHQETNKWEDRDGNNRYTTSVVAKEVIFLDKALGKRQEQPPPPDDQYEDDDIPF